jgi:hypothetical protein
MLIFQYLPSKKANAGTPGVNDVAHAQQHFYISTKAHKAKEAGALLTTLTGKREWEGHARLCQGKGYQKAVTVSGVRFYG